MNMIGIMSLSLIDDLLQSDGREVGVQSGHYLFHTGDEVMALYVVRSGDIHLIRHRTDGGAALVLQRAGPGSIVAEASLFSQRYHCDAVAASPVSAKMLSIRALRDRFRRDPVFAEAWASHVTKEVQAARFRSEVIAMRTVAARFDAWLEWHGGAPPPKGEWKRVADQLGVTPEALYRELARRRKSLAQPE
jgi:CRP-like cAMP-binding protein